MSFEEFAERAGTAVTNAASNAARPNLALLRRVRRRRAVAGGVLASLVGMAAFVGVGSVLPGPQEPPPAAPQSTTSTTTNPRTTATTTQTSATTTPEDPSDEDSNQSLPSAPPVGGEESTEEQPTEQAEPAPVDDEGFAVIADFIDVWKARDAAGMRQASASDLSDFDIQWLIDLGTPAGEPNECKQWEDDDGPVAQCYIEIPDHGQYEQETHYVLARPDADGIWEVTWAAVLTQ